MVKLQIEFIKTKPGVVKELIRLVKYWNKCVVKPLLGERRALPTSYPLEFITVYAWERADRPYSFDRLKGFKDILNILAEELPHLRYFWTINYDSSLARRAIQGMDKYSQERFVSSLFEGICSKQMPIFEFVGSVIHILTRGSDKFLFMLFTFHV